MTVPYATHDADEKDTCWTVRIRFSTLKILLDIFAQADCVCKIAVSIKASIVHHEAAHSKQKKLSNKTRCVSHDVISYLLTGAALPEKLRSSIVLQQSELFDDHHRSPGGKPPPDQLLFSN